MEKPTKKWARGMLTAVEATIKMYKEGKESNALNCALCETTEDAEGFKNCDICPWVIFKNQICTGQEPLMWIVEYTRYDDVDISKRLPRLYGWCRRLKNIINR